MKGKKWLKFKRQKTGVLCRIKLLPQAEAIIQKMESAERDTLFPNISHSTIGIYSKDYSIGLVSSFLCQHTYIARHSFATMNLDAEVPIESIAKMWGILLFPALKSMHKLRITKYQEIWIS